MKADTKWFVHDRFGMFIHWGIYSMHARFEWGKYFEEMPEEKYDIYFKHFEPDMYNPAEWAAMAKKAGMKYVVFTTKHHDGFCMWDSKYTDYKVTNTPCGKDLLRELVDAFRAEGLHIGLYYSLIDWHHPDFTIDRWHPRYRDPQWKELNAKKDMAKYRQYMIDQVTEILTEYGKIDIFWADFSYADSAKKPADDSCAWQGKGKDDWGAEKLEALIRKLQPGIIIDDRMGLPGPADVATPEQYTPAEGVKDENGDPVIWEGCQTFCQSWGYYRDEFAWKSTKQCIDMLINHVSRGGNLLLNVGPTSRGYIDPRAEKILASIGEWMKYNCRAIYGCGLPPAGLPVPEDCRYTYNPETNRLYLHILNWPFGYIILKNMADKIEYAQLLHDGSEITFRLPEKKSQPMRETVKEGEVILTLPTVKPGVEVPVIEIFLK